MPTKYLIVTFEKKILHLFIWKSNKLLGHTNTKALLKTSLPLFNKATFFS